MTEQKVVQVTAQQLVDEINRRGAEIQRRGDEIRRLHQEREKLLAACKIALPFLKSNDAADVVRAALDLARGKQ